MKAIIEREIKNYLKNPIFWLGMLIVVIQMYQNLNPYLKIHYFNSEQEIQELALPRITDKGGDIMRGYIPSSLEQRRETAYKIIKEDLVTGFEFSEEKANEIIHQLKELTVEEMSWYMAKNYGYSGIDTVLLYFDEHQGSMEEVNNYIRTNLEEHSFSYYFSRKFADFGGLFMAFFSTILLSFLFLRDTKKDTYELLHTKPLSSRQYILGKILGGMFILLFALSLLNLIFIVLCKFYEKKTGFPVVLTDIPIASFLYILPNMLMIICVYAIISLLFKNPLPTVPLLLLYIIYSNMGSRNAEGIYGYYGRPLSIMVRFPGNFFDTSPPPMVLLNQIFLILASLALTSFSIYIWKRRRVY